MKVKIRPKARGAFPERMSEIRRIRGMSQKDLAEKSGLSEVTVSRYSSGDRVPRLNDFLKIADALNVSLDTLAGRSGGPGLVAVHEAVKKAEAAAREAEQARRDAKDIFF